MNSHHRATNNPVIIAKLRAGFVISGMTRPQGSIKEMFF